MLRNITLLLLLALVAAAAGAAAPYLMYRDGSEQIWTLEAGLAETRSALQASVSAGQAQAADLTSLQARLTELQTRLAQARDAKVRTVVEETVVTEEVVRWVPNGEGVSVEITGFDELIGVKDVQIRHAYGFTDLVGIAVNESATEISYAQLGCTFVDAEGNVLANAIANKQGWMPGQSWGFTCSAQVDATGGIVRVDEMS